MLKGAGIPSTVPRTDTTNTFSQTQTFSNATSAINISSTSGKLTIGGDATSNAYTLTYINASNSIEYRIGRDGSGSDHIFRNSSNIQARIKWGATNGASQIQLSEGIAIPAGGANTTGFTLFSTANFGIFAGSGAPTLSAAQGSIYLRSDGSSTSTRVYVNTNGSTGWTAITTAT